MSSPDEIGLPEALERAASALPAEAGGIRPANGDPFQLLALLEADSAVRVLEWLLAHEPRAGGELVEAWAEQGGEAAEPLRRIDPGALPKAARKALRRAHHRLRSRGESLPEPDLGEVIATLPRVEDDLEAAWVSATDPRGTRIAYLVESHPSGGARLFVAVLDEANGVLELEVYNAGRSKIKQFIRANARREEYPVVEAPPEAVRALIARIADQHPAGRALPRSFSEWRSNLANPPEGSLTPGELVREALGGAGSEDASGLARAVEMIRSETLGPWPADKDLLEEIAQKLNEIATGIVIVAGAARQEQVERTLEDARERTYEGAFGQRTAERFEETAYVFWKRNQNEEASACLAAAAAFREQTPGSHAVGRAMLEVVFAPVLKSIEKAPEEKEGEVSLLARP